MTAVQKGAMIVVDSGPVADHSALLLASDPARLAESRMLPLSFAEVIIAGHGPSFRPGSHA